MTAEEKKRVLAAIFDSVTASAEGVDRLEPCEDWRPYIVAAIPKPVTDLRAPTERKTGLEPSVAHRLITFRAGWLELEAA
jgi:hypothetical protein